MTGRETVAMTATTTTGATEDENALPDDPEELKKLLLEERRAAEETTRENQRLKNEYWDYAMNGMIAKGLNAAAFVAHLDGRIVRCSDPAGLCGAEDDLGASVFSLIFDQLRDPRDFYASSNEDTGVHRIPRLFGEELRDELAKIMTPEIPARGRGRAKRSSIQTLFSRKEVAIFESPTKGVVDVIVSIAFGLDHNSHEWLHVSLINVDAVNCDELTGLWRRRTLMNSLARDIAECKRVLHGGGEPKPLSVIVFDADGIKKINDTYGHFVGDQVIQAMARRAKRVFSRPTDLLARMGGDEFACKIVAASEAALAQAENVRKAICGAPIPAKLSPDDTQKVMIDMSISVGIATFDPNIETSEALLARADKALYDSKRGGRNRTSVRMQALKP